MNMPRCETCPCFLPHLSVRSGICVKDPAVFTGRDDDGFDSWAQPEMMCSEVCSYHPDFPAYLAAFVAPAPSPVTLPEEA